ncbi:hypothetical protein Tco_0305344 [Tanacetum coccineum]
MQQMKDKAKESCMISFRLLHSHLEVLSNNDLKGTRTERGFKRAFAKLFDQDVQTFTGTMFLNVDQLEKQLDKEEIQEKGSMAAFRVLKIQFQQFVNSRFSLDDDDGLMTRKYFLEYTRNEVQQFHDTLIQHMESVDTSKALDASLVDTESSGTESEKQDTSNMSGNDIDADDANIRPIYNEG